MAIIDRITFRGSNRKQILVGPAELVGPSSNSAKSGFRQATGFTGPVDLYEITDGSGTAAANYTMTLKPFSENGFTKSIRGVDTIAVVKQVDGVNSPSAAPTLLGKKRVSGSAASTTLGPYGTTTNDRLYVVIDRNDVSTVKYQLEVDKA